MLPSREEIEIFSWAITNSDIAHCQWRIISGKPAIWLSERWIDKFQSTVFDVMFAIPMPRLVLLISTQIYYEYGERVKGDRFYYLPF